MKEIKKAEIKIDNAPAIAVHKKIKSLQNKRDKQAKELCYLKAKLQTICIHNDCRDEDRYVDGTYYDRAQYIKTTYCKLCGKEISEVITTGGYG